MSSSSHSLKAVSNKDIGKSAKKIDAGDPLFSLSCTSDFQIAASYTAAKICIIVPYRDGIIGKQRRADHLARFSQEFPKIFQGQVSSKPNCKSMSTNNKKEEREIERNDEQSSLSFCGSQRPLVNPNITFNEDIGGDEGSILQCGQHKKKEEKSDDKVHNFEGDSPIDIYIIEQSEDNRKFNRGKLLNVGFDIARHTKDYDLYIFHDVDLLPSSDLKWYYINQCSCHLENIKSSLSGLTATDEPLKISERTTHEAVAYQCPVHIGRVWKRYTSPQYIGGALAFCKKRFMEVNGFPNNFWGWGGEDDEIRRRINKMKFDVMEPNHGSMIDMEAMNLKQKQQFLKFHSETKNMQKWELKDEHETSWTVNGLHDLKYNIISMSFLNNIVVKYTVELPLNNHWTDNFSKINLDNALTDNRSCPSSVNVNNNVIDFSPSSQQTNCKSLSSKNQNSPPLVTDVTHIRPKRKIKSDSTDLQIDVTTTHDSFKLNTNSDERPKQKRPRLKPMKKKGL